MTRSHLNNLLKYAQPYSPEGNDREYFDPKLVGGDTKKLVIDNKQYIVDLVGNNISFSDFDFYKGIMNGSYHIESDRYYTISELKSLGIIKVKELNGRNFSDDALGATLYAWKILGDETFAGV